jgi:hypothetical protein
MSALKNRIDDEYLSVGLVIWCRIMIEMTSPSQTRAQCIQTALNYTVRNDWK